MEHLKISCLPWQLLKNSDEFDIEYWCSYAVECGLDGIDLMDAFLNREKKVMWGWDVDADKVNGTLIQEDVVGRWADAAEKTKLPFSALTIHNTMLCFDENSRQREFERICVMMDLAKKLGIAKVRPVHGWEPIDANWKAEDEEKKLEAIIRMCKMLVPEARERGLSLIFEPHPQVMLKTKNVIKLFKEIPDENFQLQFDPKHTDRTPEIALATPELLPRLGGIHLDNFVSTCSINYNVSLPEGYFKFDGIFLLLRSIAYKDWVTIEYSGKTKEHIAQSTAFLKHMASIYGFESE